MAFPRPPLRDLIARVRGEISSRTQGSAFIKRSVERVIGDVLAGLSHGMHGHFEWLQRQATAVTAEIDSLLNWGAWLQVERKGVVQAAGVAIFTGTPITTNIPAGRVMQTADAVQFITTEYKAADAGGTIAVRVQAVVAGALGNIEAGAPLSLVQTIAGVDSNGAVGPDGITGGQDIEDVEDYRLRVLQNLRLPPAGGGPGDYVAWALEVPGVTRAWERGNRMGFGTVSVAFVMDGRANIIPTAADVLAVQSHIDAERPIDMRAAYVVAPTVLEIYMIIALTPNTPAVQASVRQRLSVLFLNEADLGLPITLSKINEAISTATGEEDHSLTFITPLTPGPWEILKLGYVTFA